MNDVDPRINLLPLSNEQKLIFTRAATLVREHPGTFVSASHWLWQRYGPDATRVRKIAGGDDHEPTTEPIRTNLAEIDRWHGLQHAVFDICQTAFPAGDGAESHATRVLVIAALATLPAHGVEAFGPYANWRWEGPMQMCVLEGGTIGRMAILFDQDVDEPLRVNEDAGSYLPALTTLSSFACELVARTGGTVFRATKFYDIRELVPLLQEADVPLLTREARPASTPEEYVDALISWIEDTVSADTWCDNGGSVGLIRAFGGQLIITHTSEAHAEIAQLLQSLRERVWKSMHEGAPPDANKRSAHTDKGASKDEPPAAKNKGGDELEHPDGPIPPKAFRFKNKVTSMERIPWKLLRALWGSPQGREIAEVEREVWGEESEFDSRLKSAINKVNKAFAELGFPKTLSKSGNWLQIG